MDEDQAGASADQGGMDAAKVGAALVRILATPSFARSPRLAQFLRFVVQERLSGRTESPKEYELGVAVFGRAENYDPRLDPVVRVQARLLRFKLHEYYETVGKTDLVRIDLPKGSYLPVFAMEPDEIEAIAPPPGPRPDGWSVRMPKLRWVLAAAVVVAVVLLSLSWSSWRDAVGKVWAKTLPGRPRAAQSAAADLYLKGRYYWNKRTPDDLQKAVDYFTQSIVADPGYSKAYVGLADSYGLLREFSVMPANEAWPRALAAAKKAVELDDSLAEAHSSLGFDLFYGALDLRGGERELRRAVELNPGYVEAHHWYATALMSLGRYSEATEEIERARELDPASRSILADKGLLLFHSGHRDQAIALLQQINAAEPTFRSAHRYLSYIYLVSSDGPDYLSEARKAADSSRDPREGAILEEAEKGYAAGGTRAMLESMLRVEKRMNAEGRYSAFQVAETCALLGRKDDALHYLEASFAKREEFMAALPSQALFYPLRGEPVYQRLLTQLDFPH